MPVQRCTVCNINYPAHSGHMLCDACGEQTFYLSSVSADSDWQRAALKTRMEAEEAARAVDLIPTVEGKVMLRDDEFFISSWDVIDSGIRYRLLEQALFHVGKQTFEVLGYREADREYWIRPFEVLVTQDELNEYFSETA